MHIHWRAISIEHANGFRAIGERARPNFQWTFGPNSIGLIAERILVDGDHFFICKQRDGFGRHLREVVACEQRRGEKRPKAHVRAIFVGFHAAIADFQHVRIIPVSGESKLGKSGLTESDIGHAGIAI